jgi:hypothetical protein
MNTYAKLALILGGSMLALFIACYFIGASDGDAPARTVQTAQTV